MTTQSPPVAPSTSVRRGSWFYYVPLSVIILIVLFFSAFFRDILLPKGSLSGIWRDSILATLNGSNQYIWCGTFAIWGGLFLACNLRKFQPRRLKLSELLKPEPRDAIWITSLLLCCLIAVLSIRYFLEYQNAAAGTDTSVLLFVMLLHQALVWSSNFVKVPVANKQRRFLLDGFIFVGCFCVLLMPFNIKRETFYHGQLRWSGIYSTPNEFGLIMAVILMLAAVRVWNYAWNRRFAPAAVYVAPAVISGFCVMKSYSREAWVCILVGSLFLAWNGMRRKFSEFQNSSQLMSIESRWIRKTLLWGCVGILIGVCSLCAIKRVSQSRMLVAQRLFSAFNRADFSSRNRLASYQDGINMVMDRPLAGYGWGHLVAIHNNLYLQPGLYDGQALVLNDFLRLALRFGIPTFVIFVLFAWVWLSARPKTKLQPLNYDIVLCWTVVLMFAVGFIFSDGLCRLASGGSFWLFLTMAMDFESLVASPQKISAPVEFASTVPSK